MINCWQSTVTSVIYWVLFGHGVYVCACVFCMLYWEVCCWNGVCDCCSMLLVCIILLTTVPLCKWYDLWISVLLLFFFCCWKWPVVQSPCYFYSLNVLPSYWWVYDLVTWLYACAALACLPHRVWMRWTIASPVLRVIVSHTTRQHGRCVGHVQLLVDNG